MSIDEIKKIQLGILADVAGFCEENGLRYYLTYGTLLGAVRHKGYIPWDDDIDIMMPRPDWMKFQEMYNRRDSVYKCFSFYTDPVFPHDFIKAEHTETFQVDRYSLGYNQGVNIDIFPIDGVPKHFQSLYISVIIALRIVWSRKLFHCISESNFIKKSISLMIVNLPWGICRVCRALAHRMMRLSSYDDSETVGLLTVIGWERKELFDKAMLDGTVSLEFEGRYYSAPYRYDDILKRLYGDYMTPPPESERRPKHLIEAFWRE